MLFHLWLQKKILSENISVQRVVQLFPTYSLKISANRA